MIDPGSNSQRCFFFYLVQGLKLEQTNNKVDRRIRSLNIDLKLRIQYRQKLRREINFIASHHHDNHILECTFGLIALLTKKIIIRLLTFY